MTQDISELVYDVCVRNVLPVKTQQLWGPALSSSGTSRSWLNNAFVLIVNKSVRLFEFFETYQRKYDFQIINHHSETQVN